MSESRDKLRDLKIDRSEIDEVRPGGSLAILLIVLVLLGIAGGAAWLLLGREKPAEVQTVVVRTLGVAAGTATGSSVLDASGYVVARRQATISSKITGKIVDVLVEEGMEVAERQVLARLDDSLQRRQLELARSRVAASRAGLAETRVRIRQAELDLGRQERLSQADVGTEAALDSARTSLAALQATLGRQEEEVRVAEREVELWLQQLDDTIIRAPFAGMAVSKNAQPGEMISPAAVGGFTRTGISTIVDMSSLEIEVDVNEAYIQRVEDGQPVEAVLDAYPDWRIPATVITTIPTADRQKATVQVRIAFDERDARILPEMGVKVSFLEAAEELSSTGESTRDVLVVPARAIRRDQGATTVFRLNGKTVERRAVTLGGNRGDDVEVLGGLAQDDRVVVGGAEDLVDGAEVVVLP